MRLFEDLRSGVAYLLGDGSIWYATGLSNPEPRISVLFRTEHYQALGFRDPAGGWRLESGEAEPESVLIWRPIVSREI